MYPTKFEQWLALLSALIPVALWAGSALSSALTAGAASRRADWQRFDTLCAALYNKDKEMGLSRMLAATAELREKRFPRHAVLLVAREALDHETKGGRGAGPLADALKVLIEKRGG